MKRLVYVFCLCLLFKAQSQEYSFIPDSLRLIPIEKMIKKVPKHLEYVFYEDGSKTTMEEVMPLVMNGTLPPKMYVDPNHTYAALVVVKPKKIDFESLEANTKYAFIPDSLRLLPNEVVFRKPPPKYLEYVFYEDGSKTTMEEVTPLLMNGTLAPKMYVNEDLEYTALVVLKNK